MVPHGFSAASNGSVSGAGQGQYRCRVQLRKDDPELECADKRGNTPTNVRHRHSYGGSPVKRFLAVGKSVKSHGIQTRASAWYEPSGQKWPKIPEGGFERRMAGHIRNGRESRQAIRH